MPIRYEWDEAKRLRNLLRHGFDFADAEAVFMGVTVTIEDRRFDYGKQRFLTLGFLAGRVVAIAHTEGPDRIRVFSFRGATRREQAIFFQTLQD